MKHLRLEYLQNGLIRVHDYGCAWDVYYDAKTGKHRFGGADLPEYRQAVNEFLNKQEKVKQSA